MTKEKKKHRHRSRSPSPYRSRHDDFDHRRSHKDKKRSPYPSTSHRPEKDSKGDRHRRRSSSSDEITMKRRTGTTVDELAKIKEAGRKEKELRKAQETPEEKRARRLKKKEMKEMKHREASGWDKEYIGYTNEDNPFGDHKLSETFVWKKKLEGEGLGHLSYDEVQTLQRRKMEESARELEAVRRRRMEREREREERDQEMEKEQRDKEANYYRAWGQQEDKFHLEQAKMRSRIRIADGRAKPIDLLAKYISEQDEDVAEGATAALEMHEPTQFLVGLSMEDLEDLLEDIKVVYMELEEGANAEYWHDITIVVENELEKIRELESDAQTSRRAASINADVLKKIQQIFKGKTYNQLVLFEKQVEVKLRGGEGIDVSYWETLLQRLREQKARTRLRERHQEHLKKKLEQLKQEQGILADPLFPSGTELASLQASSSAGPSTSRGATAPSPHSSEHETEEETPQLGTEVQEEEDTRKPYDSGRYSPALLRIEDLEMDAVIYEAQDDKKKLDFQRHSVQQVGHIRTDGEDELVRRARDGMDNDEAQFSVLAPLEEQSFLWSDKYRPRKPRFFNRVHTGYEWNKYNQTHYDMDNPPPKIVQGYKFNIFYPDLIDKAQTPTYTISPIEEEMDFAVLRFKAGPPYEDIAFKIVNREWECSNKHGFRCQFQNNVFQLWFHFKRFRYRR